jgi:AcrR family transcriptional regulator
MARRTLFSRENLLDAAFRITRGRGIEALNARALAAELGCSTQPIFHVFHTMEEIKMEMLRMGTELYTSYMRQGAQRTPAYLGSGMAYLAFAREEPELFKLLFMRSREQADINGDNGDAAREAGVQIVMRDTGLSHEEATSFHLLVWIFVHGLASMIATRYLHIEGDELSTLMRDSYFSARMLYHLPPWEDKSKVPD